MTSASVAIAASAIPPVPHVNGTGDDHWTITLSNFGPIFASLTGTIDELDEAHVRLGDAIVEARRRARVRLDDQLAHIADADRALGVTA